MKDIVDETNGRRQQNEEEKVVDHTDDDGLDFIKELKGEILERLNTLYDRFEDYFYSLQELEKEVKTVKEEGAHREERLQGLQKEMETEKAFDDKSIKHMERSLEKIDEKIEDIMSEVGFGESLDVSKIPPNILEIVYQSTLDDIVAELWKSLGPGDFERVITEILEEVRLMTSGSELFRFDNNRRIKTNNLARSLSDGLISAKQIQTTYDVLLDKLLEYVPYHKAKNFRAMIKIKSQEYTVDKTSFLLDKVENMERKMTQTNQIVAALSAQLNAKGMQMDRVARDMEKKMYLRYDSALSDMKEDMKRLDEDKVGSSAMNEILLTMREIQEGQNRLQEEIDQMKALFDMKQRIYEAKIDTIAEHLKLQEKVDSVEKTIESRKRLGDLDEESRFVYYAVPDSEEGAMTAAALSKKLAGVMDKERVKDKIKELAESEFVFQRKKGKTIRYYRAAGDATEEISAPEPEGGKSEVQEKKDERPEAQEKLEEGAKEEIAPEKKKTDKKKNGRKGEGRQKKAKAEKKEAGPEPKKTDVKGKTGEKTDEKKSKEKEEQKEVEKKEVKEKEPPAQEPEEEIEKIDAETLASIIAILPEKGGLTMARIRGEAKDIKYTDILMGIKTLIDRGEVTAVQSGRKTLYRKIGKKERKKDEGD